MSTLFVRPYAGPRSSQRGGRSNIAQWISAPPLHPRPPATIILRTVYNVLRLTEMRRLRDAKGFQNILVCLLVAQFLGATALAASPQLHHIIHHDAGHDDHQCAVTMMISGGSDGAWTPPVFEAGTLIRVTAILSSDAGFVHVSPSFLSAHIFEHAPPPA